MADRKLDIKIGAKDDTGGAFRSVEQKLHQLKAAFGPRGPLKDFSELLVGGGAVAGITFTAHVLEETATQARNIADEFGRGDINAGQMGDKLARAVPILGSIYAAGRSIRELFTGEESFAAEITRAAERTNELVTVQRKSALDIKKVYDAIDDKIEGIKRKQAEAFLSGPALSLFGISTNQADAKKQIETQAKEGLEAAKAPLLEQRRKLQDELDKLLISQTTGHGIAAGVRGFFSSFTSSNAKEFAKDLSQLSGAERVQELRNQLSALDKQLRGETIKTAEKVQEAVKAIDTTAVTQRFGVFLGERLRALVDQAGAFGGKLKQAVEDFSKGASITDALRVTNLNERLSVLDQEAAAGNKAAAIEAQRLRIAEDFLAKRRELLDIINREGISEAQKAEARRQLDQLSEDEKRSLALIGNRAPEATRFAGLQEERFTSGIGSALRQGAEGTRSPIVTSNDKNTEETKKNTSTLANVKTALENLYRALTSGSGLPNWP